MGHRNLPGGADQGNEAAVARQLGKQRVGHLRHDSFEHDDVATELRSAPVGSKPPAT